MKTPKIAVVIPFFQRQTSILSRTLASVAAQNYPKDSLYVVIVHDGSPLPAEQELKMNPPPPDMRIVTVRQENAGPGAARDTGLNHLEPDTDIVAFIDSDDEWLGDHLQRAARCISAGFTAYFTNLFHVGAAEDEFTRSPQVDWQHHAEINGDPTLRVYEGDMIHQIATANIIMMTTLAISVPALGAVRFPSGFKYGGEDYLYWMELTLVGARFAYSVDPEARRGVGVNIWDSSGWGTDGLAKRTLDEARYRQQALERYARSSATKLDLRNRIAGLQVMMLLDVLHRLRRRKLVDWKVVRSLFFEIPPSVATATQLVRALVGTAA